MMPPKLEWLYTAYGVSVSLVNKFACPSNSRSRYPLAVEDLAGHMPDLEKKGDAIQYLGKMDFVGGRLQQPRAARL
jgi:hypothetical protein